MTTLFFDGFKLASDFCLWDRRGVERETVGAIIASLCLT